MNEKIISKLIGLVGACENNSKTDNTDAVVMDALLCSLDTTAEAADTDRIVSEIEGEKYTISPNCKTCPTPCGNTSDYDMKRFHDNLSLFDIKLKLLQEAVSLTQRLSAAGKGELPLEIYQAVSFLRYELAEDSYINLINKLRKMEV